MYIHFKFKFKKISKYLEHFKMRKMTFKFKIVQKCKVKILILFVYVMKRVSLIAIDS